MAITDRVYLKDARGLSNALGRRLPRGAFHGATKDALTSTDAVDALDAARRERVLSLVTDFFACGCEDSPYCGCAERGFVEYLLELRREGLGPEGIVERMERDYGVYAYEGDVYDFLDESVRTLEAVEEMADALAEHDTRKEARRIRDSLVDPGRVDAG